MKNKHGQALVEFVIILPIFIFMIFVVIDVGKIFYIKNNLESRLEDVITLYETVSNKYKIMQDLKLEKEKIKLDIKTQENYLEFNLEKEVEIITPGLNIILNNPYKAIAKRVIYHE